MQRGSEYANWCTNVYLVSNVVGPVQLIENKFYILFIRARLHLWYQKYTG